MPLTSPHAREHGLGLRHLRETTPSTPDYKSSSSTTSRGRPTNDSIGSRTKACRTSRGRLRAAGEAQRHAKLFGAIAREAAPRVAEFQPQGFSNLRLGVFDGAL